MKLYPSVRLASVVLVLTLAACSQSSSTTEKTTPAAAPAAGAKPVPVTAGWTVTEGIDAPESVYYDPDSGFIFVSQIVGQGDARDGNGRIVKLAGDGTVVSTAWATGLNAPKGLRGCQGTLWVADLDEVVGIDIASGRITSHTKIDGAKFLNDIGCTNDGTVYVADTFGTRIYAVKDGQASVFADGESLEYPNGLLVEGDHLVVGGWGKPAADFSTTVPGRLFTIDLKTKKKTLITPTPFANIDGLESDGSGGYIITDWTAGKLLRVSASGESRLLRQFAMGSADIGYVPAAHIVIVPHMNENKVAAYDISDALR